MVTCMCGPPACMHTHAQACQALGQQPHQAKPCHSRPPGRRPKGGATETPSFPATGTTVASTVTGRSYLALATRALITYSVCDSERQAKRRLGRGIRRNSRGWEAPKIRSAGALENTVSFEGACGQYAEWLPIATCCRDSSHGRGNRGAHRAPIHRGTPRSKGDGRLRDDARRPREHPFHCRHPAGSTVGKRSDAVPT